MSLTAVTVTLTITPERLAAMPPGALRDELTYRYRVAAERAASRAAPAGDLAARALIEAEAARMSAMIRHGDLPGVCEARRAHLDNPAVWHQAYGTRGRPS